MATASPGDVLDDGDVIATFDMDFAALAQISVAISSSVKLAVTNGSSVFELNGGSTLTANALHSETFAAAPGTYVVKLSGGGATVLHAAAYALKGSVA